MRIEWLGHAAFKLTSDEGVRVLMDPYDPDCYDGALRYKPIREAVDIVTISHDHPDHSFTGNLLGTPLIIKREGRHTQKDVSLESFPAFHDETEGKKRGGIRIFILQISGIALGHCGDLGAIPPPKTLDALKNLDVLLVPVGGIFTLNAEQALNLARLTNPACLIPMHYKTEKCDFDIDTIEPFLKKRPDAKVLHKSFLEISKNDRKEGAVILEPSH